MKVVPAKVHVVKEYAVSVLKALGADPKLAHEIALTPLTQSLE